MHTDGIEGGERDLIEVEEVVEVVVGGVSPHHLHIPESGDVEAVLHKADVVVCDL